MGKRDVQEEKNREEAFKAYVREAAGTGGQDGTRRGSRVDDLSKLCDLPDKGALTEEEYQRAKSRLLV
ncbi:hypothetical protein [Streptomyces sp. A0958]|uniref:SHOCT domain-containing protein n=1 Tax=Streptomyces sp. A0958 TaxID=2563101 RepID=UPI001F0DE773|nr:hypothetical protein [Streptomyces sp. A0958]